MAQHESLGSATVVFVLLALLLMICAPGRVPHSRRCVVV
jgi:hypothetical protein